MTGVVSPTTVIDETDVAEAPVLAPVRLRRDAIGYVAAAFLVLIVLAAIVGPWLMSQSATRVELRNQLLPPAWSSGGSTKHLLGTDELGRDVLSRMLSGARVTLLVGVAVTVIAGAVGTFLGLVAGYRGGRWGSFIMRVADAQLAFPGLMLVIAVIAAVGPGVGVLILVLSIYGWMIYAMVVRAVVLQVREALYVQAAAMSGARSGWILRRHLVPRTIGPLLALLPIELSRVVIAEASLSYLGLGIQPPKASWGLMIAENQGYMNRAWWSVVFPGAALSLTVLSLNLVGNAFSLHSDARQRQLKVAREARRRASRARRGEPRPVPTVAADTAAVDRGPVPLLEARHLAVDFHTERGVSHAVQDVSVSVLPGRTLAIVGESGSGKTVASLAMLGLLPRTADVVGGEVRWRGDRLDAAGQRALLGRSATMVFQDPMQALNPLVPIGRQVGEMLRKHKGMRGAAVRQRVVELLERVGIPEPERRLKQFPFELSGGMAQRVSIAIALASEPDLLIADEPTTALDVTVQKEILDLLFTLQDQLELAIILITHDLGIVAGFADDVAVMYQGRIVETATAYDLLAQPRHPYTRGLLESTPHPYRVRDRLPQIRGSAPPVPLVTAACAFLDRCPSATEACAVRPALVALDGHPEREVACWHVG